MSTAIRVRGLAKAFGGLPALRGLDLELPAGRVTALVGPNAAGKSTLVHILIGLVRADAGRVEIDGIPVGRDPGYRARIGYMPQDPAFPDNLRVRELFELVDGLRGLGATDEDTPFARRPDRELVDAFGLEEVLERRLGVLSGGTRQKVNAALAFRYGARLLLLDEPTAGLDPLARDVLKERIRRERARGTTVLVTSHVLSELRDLAEHVVYLVDGAKRYDGAADELLRTTGTDDVERAVVRLMREEGPASEPGPARRVREDAS